MEIQHMFDNLLASIDWEKAAKNSYTSFHARGVNYLNLMRTDRLTVKLYTFNHVQLNELGYLVNPHTHGYNFSHRTMVGKITNYKFALADNDEWNMYSFLTPLNGGAGLTKLLPCGLTEVERQDYQAGESYYLHHSEIHTISTTDDYAAAMLIQYHDVAPGSPTVMFAPAGEDPDCSDGLYHRMGVSQGRRMIELYKDMLSMLNDGDKDEADVF